MGFIKEKKLTKHVCQLGKSSLQMGILPSFQLLSTSLNGIPNDTVLAVEALTQTTALFSSPACMALYSRLPTYVAVAVVYVVLEAAAAAAAAVDGFCLQL